MGLQASTRSVTCDDDFFVPAASEAVWLLRRRLRVTVHSPPAPCVLRPRLTRGRTLNLHKTSVGKTFDNLNCNCGSGQEKVIRVHIWLNINVRTTIENLRPAAEPGSVF